MDKFHPQGLIDGVTHITSCVDLKSITINRLHYEMMREYLRRQTIFLGGNHLGFDHGLKICGVEVLHEGNSFKFDYEEKATILFLIDRYLEITQGACHPSIKHTRKMCERLLEKINKPA